MCWFRGIRWPYGWPEVACCNPFYPPMNELGEQPIWWQHRISPLLLSCKSFCAPGDVFSAHAWNGSSVYLLVCEIRSFVKAPVKLKPTSFNFFSPTMWYLSGVTSARMESSPDDYRIQSFDMDTQMLLKTALKGQQVTVVWYENVLFPVANIFHNVMPPRTIFFCLVYFRSKFSESGEGIKYHHRPVFKGPGVQQRGWAHLLHYCTGPCNNLLALTI